MNQGKLAPVLLMLWRSKRLRRKASSSLLCQAISLTAATGALERQASFFDSIQQSRFSARSRQRTEDERLEASGQASVIASASVAFMDPRTIAVMDAKALFDSVSSDLTAGEGGGDHQGMPLCASRATPATPLDSAQLESQLCADEG